MIDSVSKLAKQFSVSTGTIRKALNVLSTEGLVKHHHGRGTVVAYPLQQGEFAIVMRPSLIEAGASPFYRETARLLSEKISGHNGGWSPKLYLGEKTNLGRNYPATPDLLNPDTTKRLLGVFSFHPLYGLAGQLRQNIPIVSFTSPDKVDVEGTSDVFVNRDTSICYEEITQYLHTLGCKTVGFIWHHVDRPLTPKEKHDVSFAKHAVAAGLSTQEKWITAIVGDVSERIAYEHFVEFWKQGDHPDAIVVDDDIVACGVLRAMLHMQIQAPEQIRLVTFANKGVELPYHLPVTRYEYDMDEMAAVAVDAMIKLLNGQKLKQNEIYIPGKLIKAQTA